MELKVVHLHWLLIPVLNTFSTFIIYFYNIFLAPVCDVDCVKILRCKGESHQQIQGGFIRSHKPRCKVGDLCQFYRYFNGECSQKNTNVFLPPEFFGRPSLTHSPPYTNEIRNKRMNHLQQCFLQKLKFPNLFGFPSIS